MTTDPHSAPTTGARLTLGQALAGFAFASDLAFGVELEDGITSCYVAERLAESMGLSEEERALLYYTAMLKHAGCTTWTTPLAELFQGPEIEARRDLLVFGGFDSHESRLDWAQRYIGAGRPQPEREQAIEKFFLGAESSLAEGFRSTAEVCVRIMNRLGLPQSVQRAGFSLYERWDGHGHTQSLAGTDIPLAARIVSPTYELVPVFRRDGLEAARRAALAGRRTAYAPDVIDAFQELCERAEFREGLSSDAIWEIVTSREPDTPLAAFGDERMESLALAFADFIDFKSPSSAAHSRRVGRITEQIARVLRCSESETTLYRRAGYVHDLGLVAVPSFVLNKPEASLSATERESVRLHSYFGERILDRVPAMTELLPLVGQHHERVDGKGYFRGLRGREILVGARIIAVANRLDELTHDSPGQAALDVVVALNVLVAESGTLLDPEIVQAVRTTMTGQRPRHDRGWPASLTDREVEVLRLAAKGLSRRETGVRLSISEATVRHHLEHIYTKTQTNTRVGAILFAMENDLLP